MHETCANARKLPDRRGRRMKARPRRRAWPRNRWHPPHLQYSNSARSAPRRSTHRARLISSAIAARPRRACRRCGHPPAHGGGGGQFGSVECVNSQGMWSCRRQYTLRRAALQRNSIRGVRTVKVPQAAHGTEVTGNCRCPALAWRHANGAPLHGGRPKTGVRVDFHSGPRWVRLTSGAARCGRAGGIAPAVLRSWR